MTNSWTFRRRSDVERFWREVRDVPRRGNGIYSIDARSRMVRETSNDRRFEVKVTLDGVEALARELRD